MAALADSDNKVRSYAVSGLGKRDDPRARSALIDFRKREKEKPDIKALFTNASMRTLKDVSSPAVMAKLLQHRHSPVRLQAAQALHKAAGEAATKAALAAFNHPDPAVRRGHCRLDEGSG